MDREGTGKNGSLLMFRKSCVKVAQAMPGLARWIGEYSEIPCLVDKGESYGEWWP